MDATSQLRNLLWKVMRHPFLAGEAEEVKRLVGIPRTSLLKEGRILAVAHSQAESVETLSQNEHIPLRCEWRVL